MRKIKSEIALILTPEGQQKLKEKLKGEPINIREFFGSDCDKKKVDTATGMSFYYWKSVTRFVDPGGEFLDGFLMLLTRKYYRYIRLCENESEIEVSGRLEDTPFDLKVVTEIKFNLD